MKKLITTIALALSVMTASAQWFKQVVPADPLMGHGEQTVCMYADTTSAAGFFYQTDIDNTFFLKIDHNIFDVEYFNNKYQVCARVGLYSGPNLKEAINLWLCADAGKLNILYVMRPSNQTKKARKILEHLKLWGNKVRIVLPIYGKGNLDITIPNIPNI